MSVNTEIAISCNMQRMTETEHDVVLNLIFIETNQNQIIGALTAIISNNFKRMYTFS